MAMPRPLALLVALIVGVAAAIFFTPPPAGVSVNVMHTGGLLVLVMGLWATGALPESLTALIFFALAVLLMRQRLRFCLFQVMSVKVQRVQRSI